VPSQNVFTWKDGQGWLVLSGGPEPTGAVRATAIERAAVGELVASIVISGEQTANDDVLDDLQELGAPTGYVVNALTEDDDTIKQQLKDAGLIALSTSAPAREVRSALLGAALDGITEAYARGAVILAEGTAAAVFGAYILDGERVVDGVNWLEHGFVAPGVTSAADSGDVQWVVSQQPDVIVVGVGVGSALALGGAGIVETWGHKQITIALGSAYTQE